MSALGDVAAALLPPEAGGPAPEAVASDARRLLARMPGAQRAALGMALAGVEVASLLRHRRTLGQVEHIQRSALMARIASLGSLGAATVDGLKTLVLLAAGAEEHAASIHAVANDGEPANADSDLAVVDPADLDPGRHWDAVVIGSGAGGAFAARELARSGHEVLIVEEGERWDSQRIRSLHPLDRFAGMYRDAGSTVALGSPPVALPMGCAVGGTTVMNSGTCFRPPAGVVDAWRDVHGFDLAANGLEERLDDVEATLRVGPVPLEIMGRNGRLALAGAEKLGWASAPLLRNAPGCRGSCQCAIGCPNNAKFGVHLNALPQACAAGATIATGLRTDRIINDGTRATGVAARSRDGRSITLAADRVIVACGTTETPPLLRRSGLAGHPRVGRGLSIHPAVGATGRFAEPVVAWEGVMQSAGIEELRDRGILLEATSTPPGMGAMVTPGFGAELVERIGRSDHLASLGAMIADEPSGRVIGAGRPLITYQISKRDRGRLVEALAAIARVLLAAGAEEVEMGGGAPAVRADREVETAAARIRVRKLHLAAFHPTGTVAAGSDERRHPVTGTGALRGVQRVWVADGSILPECPGVNPQVSIMAMASGVGQVAAAVT